PRSWTCWRIRQMRRFSVPAPPLRRISGCLWAGTRSTRPRYWRLGMKVLLETVIGSGKAGKFILDHCRDCGILLPADCVRDDFSTGINVVLVSRDGSRH